MAKKTSQNLSQSETDSDYELKPGEEAYYHLLIEKVIWDNTSDPLRPNKLSNPQLFKCSDKDYRQFLIDHKNLGYTIVKTLHDPDTAKTLAIIEDLKAKADKAAGGIAATKK